MGRNLRDIGTQERLSPDQLDRAERIIADIETLRTEILADPGYPGEGGAMRSRAHDVFDKIRGAAVQASWGLPQGPAPTPHV